MGRYSHLSDDELDSLLAQAAPESTRTGATDQLFGGGQWSTAGAGLNFMDRARTSFGGDQDARAKLLERALKPGERVMRHPDGFLGIAGTDGTIRRVDPEGLDLPGDVADWAGDAPALFGGALGGLAGFGAGGIPGAAVGAASGSALGETARQGVSQALGSGEKTDVGRVAGEGMWGAIGELVGGLPVSKLLTGLFKRSKEAPDAKALMDDVRDFDINYGTQLEGLSPASARSGSDALAQMEQQVRQSPFGGQRLREGTDRPFQQELERGFDQIRKEGGTTQPGAPGPYNRDLAPGEAGRSLYAAAEKAQAARNETVDALYDNLRARLPSDMPVAPTNTMAALEALQRRPMARSGLPMVQEHRAGIGALLENAEQIRTFEDLDGLRQVLQAQMKDPNNPLSRREEAGNVLTALKADVLKFFDDVDEALPALGGQAREAKTAARTNFDLQEMSTARLLNDELGAADLPTALRGMNVDKVEAFKAQVGGRRHGPHPSTGQGLDAWQQTVAQVLDDLKAAARNSKESTRDRYVLSGDRLQTELDRWKPGALEAVVGPEIHAALRQFADIARGLNSAERNFANTSRTAQHNAGALQMVGEFLRNPGAAAGALVGKIGAEAGAGYLLGTRGGQRYLLGEAAWQRPQSLLEILGRVTGQGAVKEGFSAAGLRQR